MSEEISLSGKLRCPSLLSFVFFSKGATGVFPRLVSQSPAHIINIVTFYSLINPLFHHFQFTNQCLLCSGALEDGITWEAGSSTSAQRRFSDWNQLIPIQSFLFVSGMKAICDHSQMPKLSSTAESLQEKWEIMYQIFLQLRPSMETCTHILTAQKGLVLKEKLSISSPHKANL